MTQSAGGEPESLEFVWIKSPYPVVAAGLKSALEDRARVHLGAEAPIGKVPSCAIYDTGGVEGGLSEGLARIKEVSPDISIVVFNLHLDLPLARAALRGGARGFIHAGMQLDQIVHAVEAAMKGEIAVPRKLLEYMVMNEGPIDLDALTSRQRENLELIAEGLSNAQIAKNLYLSESTVKQHLRAAYKLLNVDNRTEAARLIRGS